MAQLDDVKYATQITKVNNLSAKWYKASSNDVYDSFVYHYNKHVLTELPKAGKPVVSMEKYLDDAVAFWEANNDRAIEWSINRGTEMGKKIVGNPGGIYTNDGKVVSFWYVPSN